VVLTWLQRAWRAFQASYDPDELVAASTPGAALFSSLSLIATLLALGYAPGLRDLTSLTHVGWSVVLALVGSIFTLLAWRQGCRGPWGTLFTLFDNPFYSASVGLAAVSSRPNVGLALAVIQGLMITLFPGRSYALSGLFLVMMALPQLILILVFQPELEIGLILLASYVMMIVVSQATGARRIARERQAKLEAALDVADRLADESMQAALTSTLLTLGHFLHELRNFQTAIAVNLEFVETDEGLSSEVRSALQEAQDAQRQQAALLRETIEDLRGRSRPGRTSFHLGNVLAAEGQKHGPEIAVVGHLDFEVAGNPEHLRVVMLNLFRNARQAGAARIECELRLEPSGSAIRLLVKDDGPGLPEGLHPQLFDSFVTSSKAGGSGLGLYLVRRHVELLGGQIRVESPGSGGTQFTIILPGRVLTPSTRALDDAPSDSVESNSLPEQKKFGS
jgi:signal transduction histidine kinase